MPPSGPDGSLRSADAGAKRPPPGAGSRWRTRAGFGYTAPIGTTDDGRFRRLTVHLPPAYAQQLFDAREAGATDQQLRQIIADGFRTTCFQDGGARAMGLSDVAINDIDYIDLDY